MNLSQGKLADGLMGELLEVIYKYEEAVLLPTVVGILDLIKMQLVEEHLAESEDDDDDE